MVSRAIVIVLAVLALSCAPSSQFLRSTVPLNIHFPGTKPLRLIDTTVNLAVVLVDFADSRLNDGSLPIQDADTTFFPGDAINSVGSMGWVRNSRGALQKKIRKYHYEDYWNKYFWTNSSQPYVSPDYDSHGSMFSGSVRSYYDEVSYGNLHLVPPITHDGPDEIEDMFHTGIVNNVDSTGTGKFVRWIKLPGKKSEYMENKTGIIGPALHSLDSLHHLPSSNPDYLWFNPATFKGRYAIVGAGSNIGGATYYFNNAFATSEKAYYVPNQFPESKLDGILQPIHELAHTFGLEHIVIGSFDPMHWGALTPLAQDCPPHFNPLTKYMMGWLRPDDILVIDSTSKGITLHPSEETRDRQHPAAVFIKLNHPELNSDRNESRITPANEYLIIEYRSRTGFNRLTGGSTLPPDTTFNGGLLIWHFDEANAFPYPSTYQISGYMSLEVPGYGPNYPRAKDQSPTDYITPGQTFELPADHVFSNHAKGKGSILKIEKVKIEEGNMGFDLIMTNR